MVALRYLEQLGQDSIREHEDALMARLLEGVRGIAPVQIYGNPDMADDRASILSFNYVGQVLC